MKLAVTCPQCHSRLMDAERGVKTLTKVINPYDLGPPKMRWTPDYYLKCWQCKNKVGIKKINQ
ncbi:MAG: hypothetical protein RSD54_09135 [Ruthenibacterium sp.]